MSDSKIRIKNIGSDVAPIRLIKMSNESTLTIDTLEVGEIDSFKRTPEDIKFCLEPLKESVVEVTTADANVLGEMILAGIIETRYDAAETFIINEEVTAVETTVDVLFTSRINDQIIGNIERKQHYFLKLGNLTDLGIANVNNVSIMSTKYAAGTGELIGTSNTVLPKNRVFVTSTKDIIYPMVISELEPSTFTDLIVDLDGTRTLFAPTFHRLNLNVTVENNSEISPVTVRGFDTLFATESGNYNFGQIKQANNFSIGNNTSIKNDQVAKAITALFQYKLDGSIVLQQSFVIEFEHWLITDSSEVTMSIGSTTYNKQQIITGSVLVNNKYYFLVNVSNKNLTGMMVEINADYDGPVYKDFVKTHYLFTFTGTVTPPPTIPMFALSSRMARVEVKNENTYYYEGYRYLQFKVPVTEAAMVCIFPIISAQNYTIKTLATPTTITAISDKQKLAEFLRLKVNDPLMTYDETKPTIFGFEKAGEAIFQIAVPSGITGEIYFTLKPVGGTGNLMYYDNDQMTLRGVTDRLPPPKHMLDTVVNQKITTVDADTTIRAYYMFNETLMPGQAIAWDNLFSGEFARLTLVDEQHKYIDIVDEYWQPIRTFDKYAYPLTLNNRYVTGYKNYVNPSNGLTIKSPFDIDVTDDEYFDNWMSGMMMVLYRSPTNELYLIGYHKSNGIAVAVNKVIKISNNLIEMGYPLEKGMRPFVSIPNSTAYEVTHITKPYNVTFEELTTFETNQTLEMNTFIRLTDISGYNTSIK